MADLERVLSLSERVAVRGRQLPPLAGAAIARMARMGLAGVGHVLYPPIAAERLCSAALRLVDVLGGTEAYRALYGLPLGAGCALKARHAVYSKARWMVSVGVVRKLRVSELASGLYVEADGCEVRDAVRRVLGAVAGRLARSPAPATIYVGAQKSGEPLLYLEARALSPLVSAYGRGRAEALVRRAYEALGLLGDEPRCRLWSPGGRGAVWGEEVGALLELSRAASVLGRYPLQTALPALAALHAAGAASAAELAKLLEGRGLRFSRSTLSKALRALHRAGLAERVSPGVYAITEEGRRLVMLACRCCRGC